MNNDQNTQLVLWGIGTPRTMRAHWALHELSLNYDARVIRTRAPETQTAEFAILNPRRKIPVLQDGEFVITESAAIVAYLADRYTDRDELAPARQLERARWLEWCFFIMTELDATSNYVIRRHQGLKSIYGEAPAAIEAAKSYFLKQLDCVNATLMANPKYLMGDRFTTADILLTTCLTDALGNNILLPNSCAEYLNRMRDRSAYRTAYAVNHPQIT